MAAAYFLMAPLLDSGGGIIQGAIIGATEATLQGAPGEELVTSRVASWWPWIVIALMVPTLAVVIALAVGPRRTKMVEHAVFSLHVHSAALIFMGMGLVLGWVATRVPGEQFLLWVAVIVYVLSFPYIVVALRRHYTLSVGRTVWASVVSLVAYSVVATLTLAVLVALISPGTA